MLYSSEFAGEEANERERIVAMGLEGIDKLPVEIILICVDYMDPTSASRFSRTCKDFTVTLKDRLKEKIKEHAQLREDFRQKGWFHMDVVLEPGSPMIQAVQHGRIDALRGFLEAGLSANLTNRDLIPLTAMATYYDQVEAVKLLMEYNANPWLVKPWLYPEQEPLYSALEKKGPMNGLVEAFLGAGAKIRSITAFQLLANRENALENIKLAVKNGSDLSNLDLGFYENGSSVIQYLVRMAQVDICITEYILGLWPDLLNHRNDEGNTTLSTAVIYQNLEMAVFLLDRGIELVGGDLKNAIFAMFTQGSQWRIVVEKILARPDADLNAVWGRSAQDARSAIPLKRAWQRHDRKAVMIIFEDPSMDFRREVIEWMPELMEREWY